MCLRTILLDNGLQFCSKLSQAVHQLLGVHKLATSCYHPNCNRGIERGNHTIAQMLAMVVNGRQDDWGLHLPHVEFAHSNSVSAATGLTPNEVHMGIPPRLPLAGFDHTGVVRHQSLARDHLAYCDLATDGKSARMTLSAHTTPSPLLVVTAETPPTPTRCVQHILSFLVVGHGCTTLPPSSARVWTQTPTPRYLRRNSRLLDGPVQDPGSRSLPCRRDP